MGLLDSIKKKMTQKDSDQISLIAPLSGTIISLEEVPDPVFSGKIVGDGVAILPTGNQIVAPCDGTINKIFNTNHAFSMSTPSGIELFVHFGIDTVTGNGKGFNRIAKEGQKVKTGDIIIEVDLPYFKEHAKSIATPIVISNMEEIKSIERYSGEVLQGKDPIFTVQKL